MIKIFTKRKLKNKIALSILEVLLSALILLLLIGIGSDIIYHSFRVSREERGLAFIRKEAIKSLNWITNEFRRSHGASLDYGITPVLDVPVAISFLSPLGNDPNGSEPTETVPSPKWKTYVIYYMKPDPKNPATADTTQKYILKRRSFLPSDVYYSDVFNEFVTTPKKLKPEDLIYICNEPSGGDPVRTIARNLYQIEILEKEANYCTISIETRDKSAKGGEIRTVYTSRVLMRNTLLQAH